MGTQAQPMSRWPLAGRDGELETFSTAWGERRCQGVVIHGPAGVGKSRLAEECLAEAARQGWKTRRATASAAAAAVPLGAIAHLIPPAVDLSDPVAGFAAIATALAGPQRDRHWAIWVDDLHLLDTTSAVLLRQLLDTPVVRLIATVRSGEPVGEAVAALTSENAMHRIDLTAFGQQQTQGVLEAALGGPVSRRTLHELYTASGGNALYLRELILGALDSGALTSDGEIWELTASHLAGTPRLAELIESRLAAAGPTAYPLLDLLALTEPLPLADAQQAAPLDVLADLEQAGLIHVTTSRRRTTLQLAHPLYGDILRENIPALRRRTLLLQQAQRAQAHGARRRDDPLHIATWQLAATGTADPALLIQAAALARHAHDYPQVVALLEALPDGEHTVTTGLITGEAYFQMGRWDQAETVLARTDTAATDETDALAVTLARSTNLVWSNAPLTRALAINDAAYDRVASPTGRRMLRTNEGFLRIIAGQPRQGLTCLADLETDPATDSDINAWLRGALMKPFALPLVGRTGEAVDWAERAHAIHRQVDEQALVSHPAVQRVPLVLALTEAGRIIDALETGTQAHAELAKEGLVVRVWLNVFLGRAQWLAGHPIEARRWWAEAAALARTIDHAMVLHLVLPGLAACAALLGDLRPAETALAEHRTLPPIPPGILSAGEEAIGEAWLHAARGQLNQARTILTQAATTAHETGHLTSEALLLTDVARLGGAKNVQGRLTELAEQCDGALGPARARLAAALAADDPDQLITAASELEAIGADLPAAEAAAAAAAAWQRASQARKAAAASQQAQTCADRCQGARTPLLATAEAAAVLTAREKEIALLAAAGTASKDIADTLHLSVRTVDNHLQRAYAKLGVTTRRELATALGTPTTRPAPPAASTR
ncbi:LuxR C-terminal-related transcriptional regulator [Streptomyces djakartensis]|uniref:LuxR C-terminal-related transcriptional regulator n=1 Tax=Streptomyces djakartensis TaxID=68193 RepID=UPI0034DFFF3D